MLAMDSILWSHCKGNWIEEDESISQARDLEKTWGMIAKSRGATELILMQHELWPQEI